MTTPANPDTSNSVGATDDASKGGLLNTGSDTILNGINNAIASNAEAAQTAATNSAASASTASTQATNAANSATTASTKASEAAADAVNTAADVISTAADRVQTGLDRTAASTSASNAATSETNAAGSATAAAGSASSVAVNAAAAAASETAAAASETAAATSETNAANSATSAGNSVTAATTAKTAAETAKTGAETAETNAANSATAAATSQTNSAANAISAASSASTATTQATNASTSATAAATSATNSATSATASETAKTASEAARDQALAAFDNFDDKYLGEKSSDPTVDNDGDPLQAGMLYFNTTDNVMKVYTGSAWVAAYVSGQGFASLSGADFTGAITAPSINLASTTLVNSILDEDNMASNSATALSTQQAIKSYVDTQVATVPVGDITAVTAGTGLSGGGTSGAVTLDIDSTVATLTGTQTLTNKTLGATSVTGNLTFTGAQTVDGRDVSVDGTKLDTIETNADVTDTTNVTAAGALMDSEVTNLAQVKAFDSSDYATAAQGTLAASALQSGDNVSVLTNNAGYLTSVPAQSFSSLTGKPTTVSGYGITDAFDGAYGSLTGTPTIPTNNNQLTNGAGYITSVPAQSFASLTSKPTTISGYGITDVVSQFTAGTNITIAANGTIASTAVATTNASDLTSGTLPDARFPSALPAISGAALTNLPGGADLYAANESSPTAQPSATGGNAIAIGDSAIGSGDDALAGPLSRAAGNGSVALGINSNSTSYGAGGNFSVSLGYQSRAMALQSNAMGSGAYVDSDSRGGLALGEGPYVQQCDYGVAIGPTARVHGGNTITQAMALGPSYSSGQDSLAAQIGNNTSSYGATGPNSIAMSKLAKATGEGAIAIGRDTVASGDDAVAIGERNEATDHNAIAMGFDSVASANFAIAMGYTATASANYSVAIGQNNTASHDSSFSIGNNVQSTAANQINLGGTADTVRISETYTLPTADGSANQVLTTNGSGVVSFADAGGGGGASTEISILAKTASYTVVAGDAGKVISFSGGAYTATLTAAATLGSGFFCYIENNAATGQDQHNVTIDGNSSETIDGRTTFIVRQGERVQLVCDGSNFRLISAFHRGIATNMRSDFFNPPQALGDESVAIGLGTIAGVGNTSNSTAIGTNAQAGSAALALGSSTNAGSSQSTALGKNSGGGGSVTATGSGAMALGGSYASGADSLAAAITNNTSSYGATATSAIAIGNQSKATGNYSISIGRSNNVSGPNGASALGQSCTVSGEAAFACGNINIASGAYSQAIGNGANTANIHGKFAKANGYFSNYADAQNGQFVLRGNTTDTTAKILTTNNGTAATTNQIILPNTSAYSFSGTLIAREDATDGSDYAAWEIKGALLRDANAASTVLGNGIQNKLYATAGASAWAIALTADTTNGGLKIEVTGAASTNIRWVATVNTSEVTYA